MNAPQWLLPVLDWLAVIGASSRAFSIVVFGYPLAAAAIFCAVLALLCVGIVGAIVILGMRSKDPTEW
jgi:hypothetical protein